MKNDGIKAVIIRTGYGRESSQKDSMFESHYKNAKSENYDLEDNSQVKLGKAKLTEIAELFCETIKKSGYNINDYKDGYAGAYNCYIDRLQLILS